MLKLMMLYLSSLLIFLAGKANDVPVKKKAIAVSFKKAFQPDTAKIKLRHFDKAAIDKYKNDPSFNYTVEKGQGGVSLWDRFWRWFWHVLERLFSKLPHGSSSANFLKYIILGVAAFLVIYLILRLLKVDLLKIFSKKQQSGDVPYTEFLENIHEIQFTDAIESALAEKNYRLAVRLLYLQSLKQLNDANLISWRIEKTNNAYLTELAGKEQFPFFKILTRQFEYIWYGDFPVDGNSFQNINATFQDFKQRLR